MSEILGSLGLIVGGGFDTTTALTAHSLEWLSEYPIQRELLSRERKYSRLCNRRVPAAHSTPAPGNGRTFSDDVEVEGTKFGKRDSGFGFHGLWPTVIRRFSKTRMK